jgi:hypothetical protein
LKALLKAFARVSLGRKAIISMTINIREAS